MKNATSKVLLVIAIAAVLALVVIGTLYATKSGPFKPVVKTEMIPDQEAPKADSNPATENTTDTKTIAQSNDGNLSTKITQLEVVDGVLLVRSESVGSVDGKCILKLVPRGQPIVQEASTKTAGDMTTCAGFDIPRSQLTDSSYEVILIVEANDQKSVTKTQLAL